MRSDVFLLLQKEVWSFRRTNEEDLKLQSHTSMTGHFLQKRRHMVVALRFI